MEALKRYFTKNFEQLFVLLILISVAVINHYAPYKLAFLNFYFIPILLAAYYLGYRQSMYGAVLCICLVAIYVILTPESFIVTQTFPDLTMSVVVWAAFLILTGAMVGRLQLRLRREVSERTVLNEELTENKIVLDELSQQLQEHTEHLEEKVLERTEHLEKTRQSIENLKEKVEEALYATMDPTVVKLIIEKRLRTEKKNLSVMFTDLVAFTPYSEERGPEVVVLQLNRFFAEMEDVLLGYGAHIDKYMGDGIMAEFGAPVEYERHALMAVVAGIKMQERVTQGDFPWRMRIGVATGEAIIGLIGQKRQTYTALGDVVNLASRIQEICVPGTVTIDESTYEYVRPYVQAKRKTVHSFSKMTDAELENEIVACSALLDQDPDNRELLKRIGFLFLRGNDPVQANDYLRRCMELDPEDDQVKLAFAESSMQLGQMHAIQLRGKKTRLHLYEVLGLRDRLHNLEAIPPSLYNAYCDRVDRLAAYPEDIVLPVEVLDGSIGHGRVVGFLSFAIADRLNLPDRDKLDILQSGYLCDVGKTIIPHHLLNRAGALNEKEFEEVAKHPRESVRILRKMGYGNEALFQIVTAHHENFNGSGYPVGLAGSDIPLGSRIVAVADSYDALTSWRPYRNRWDYRAAFAELGKTAASGKLDVQVVQVLGKLLGFDG
jgi:adenylate cyclase